MSFTCQAGLVVENERKCEHCGQTDRGVCGRLPDMQQRLIDDLVAALKACRSALDLLMGDSDLPEDDSPAMKAMQLASAAIVKAEGPAATLGDAVRAARGGPAPIERKGYA